MMSWSSGMINHFSGTDKCCPNSPSTRMDTSYASSLDVSMAGSTAGSPLKYIFMGTKSLFDNLYHHKPIQRQRKKWGKWDRKTFREYLGSDKRHTGAVRTVCNGSEAGIATSHMLETYTHHLALINYGLPLLEAEVGLWTQKSSGAFWMLDCSVRGCALFPIYFFQTFLIPISFPDPGLSFPSLCVLYDLSHLFKQREVNSPREYICWPSGHTLIPECSHRPISPFLTTTGRCFLGYKQYIMLMHSQILFKLELELIPILLI